MKKILILIFFLACTTSQAQSICQSLMNAMPNPQYYGKYIREQGFVCEDGYITAYYTYGEGDNQQVFSLMLTDTKNRANLGMLEDAQSKYEIARKSTDKSALTISRLKLGTKGIVAHDINTGTKRIYGYKVILKNRYVLDVMANSDTITNLNEFQDFIADYISKINETALPQ